jgi:hypothetical protein
MRFRTSAIVGSVIVLWLLAAPVSAQLTTGTVTGTIKDAQGGVIPGATVVLTSATRNTEMTPAFTNATGDFVITNVAPDAYNVTVTMEGFKTLKRGPIAVSAGDRVAVGTLNIEVGGLAETVVVTGEAPLVQAQSGERSYAVPTNAVQNLPITTRSFVALASLAPGVANNTEGQQVARVGDRSSTGGGNGNIMMDGISTMDTGSNSILLQMNVETIAEVKVLVSGYQAEYGRSSGVQVSAVTKSGTNQFHGSAYGVFRNSRWYENSQTNILDGRPKATVNEKDLGYSIGGPIGKPGGNNKLFFFYAHEFMPRTMGGDTQQYRFPTALERAGDFSQTLDNNGNLYTYIRDPLLPGAANTCSATNQSTCFKDGGVVGRIPQNRLYQTGINLLKMYPMPNVNAATYNYEVVRPEYSLRANQPAIRIDYMPIQKLRATFKYAGWAQGSDTIIGTTPGWSDTRQYNPFVRTIAVNSTYSINSTTFLEATWGMGQNSLTGCALAQGSTGPNDCRSGFPVNDNAALKNVGLSGLPFIYPDAAVVNPSYFAFEALSGVNPVIWDGTRIGMVPNLTWGSRIANAPQNIPFPGYLNTNKTWDFSTSLTKVSGRHTLKGGFYSTHSLKAQQRQGWQGTISFAQDTSNPLDSTYGYSNAALGIFSSYTQNSKYIEGMFVYTNLEGYIQDNWKVNDRLTLDFGMRLVNQQPQYDQLLQASNWLPDKWSLSSAPYVYLAGCPGGAAGPCQSTRQAMDPRTGALLGANTAPAIGTIVPNSGNSLNGLFQAGQGIADTAYLWPSMVVGPRFGAAYDLTGQQKIILRGGAGLFFDRTSGNAVMSIIQNPPALESVTIRYTTLQSMSSGLRTQGAPALSPYQYESKIPSTWTWNGGVQLMLPWATALDVEYTGLHAYNVVQQPDLNAIDFGTAFLPAYQDKTLNASTIPGATALTTDAMRSIRGYGSISMFMDRDWQTSHTLQMSVNRRFRNGLSFGFNDTWTLYQAQSSTPVRLQHAADGTYTVRADQAQADQLLGKYIPTVHVMKGNFVWDMPDVKGGGSAAKFVGYIVNDWQLSGVWTGNTGTAYTVGVSYANGSGNVNITGSPSYGGRVKIVGDTGGGCSSDPLRQLNAAGFAPPDIGSVGLESGSDYARSCFFSVLDLSLARNIRLGGTRNFQLRFDFFNAPNSAIITGRYSTLQVASPLDPTVKNLPNDGSGVDRTLPKNAGFGVANAYQAPRRIQIQLRFQF